MAMPWNDRRDRFSWVRSVTLLAVLAPGVVLAVAWLSGWLGAEPLERATDETGLWAIRFLVLSLAITPLRRISGWGRPIIVRRMIGLAAAGYALAHLTLYIVDHDIDLVKVASEIIARNYLAVGFAAVLGLTLLAATSFDAMIRRMGRNWNRLHRLAYGLAGLAILHFFMQTKGIADEAALMMGLFVLLMLLRAGWAMGARADSPVMLGAITVTAAMATAWLEAAWYWLGKDWPWSRAVLILEAHVTHVPTVRPAWWVLATGLALAAVALVRRLRRWRPKAAVAAE